MSGRLRARRLLLAFLLLPMTLPGPAARSVGPGYITILFGRGQYQATQGSNCTPSPGAPTILDTASWMSSQGLSGTIGAIVNRTSLTSRTCLGYATFVSWADLAKLRDRHGWSAISQSLTYSRLNVTNVVQETCGTIPAFQSQGHMRAWGMFAYPAVAGNANQDSSLYPVINSCFAFIRKYGNGITQTTRAQARTPPHFVRTFAVSGGRCASSAEPCSMMPLSYAYSSLELLTKALSPGPNQYSVVQFYRLVTGSRPSGGGGTWDCTSPTWADHWTSLPELYCFDDFKKAIQSRSTTAVVTDPATVAEAWNVQPGPA